MSILNQIQGNTNIQGSYKFRLLVRDHLIELKKTALVTPVPGDVSSMYKNNIHGIYKELGLRSVYFFIADLLNNVDNETNYNEIDVVLIPDMVELNKLERRMK